MSTKTNPSIGSHLPIDNFSDRRLRQNLVENFFREMFPANFSLIPDKDSNKPCKLALVWLAIKQLVLILSEDVDVDEREYSVKSSHASLNRHFVDLLSDFQGDRTIEYFKDRISKAYQVKDISVGAAEKLWICASDSQWENYNSMLLVCMRIATLFADDRLDIFKPDYFPTAIIDPLNSADNNQGPITTVLAAPKSRRNKKNRSRNLSDLEKAPIRADG